MFYSEFWVRIYIFKEFIRLWFILFFLIYPPTHRIVSAKKKFLILSGGKSLNFDFLGNSNKNQNKKYRNITFAFEFIYLFIFLKIFSSPNQLPK